MQRDGFEGDRLEVVGVARFTPTVTEALLLVSYSRHSSISLLVLFCYQFSPVSSSNVASETEDQRTKEKATDFKYLFTLFDSDSDGTITANELDGVMRWLNDIEPSESEIWRGRISSAITDARGQQFLITRNLSLSGPGEWSPHGKVDERLKEIGQESMQDEARSAEKSSP
ncbi:unnamed protein product [Toxocara canis]|uniref:EF-hand domain-containing protein n=1 Tax=Toxocara canis TaxID=6265 RepID=A0A183VAW6_TOXCA|nr:unnamed protein product [Toxocara canis]